MRYNELIPSLQKLTKEEITQSEIGRILGVSRSNINYKKTANADFSKEDVQKLLTHFNVNLDTVHTGTINLPYYPEITASCGHGGFALEYPPKVETMPVPTSLGFSKGGKYFIIDAFGDSMEKTIFDRQKVIFEDWQDRQVIDDKIYFFMYEGRYYIKRLAFNFDEYIVMSDNTKYETKKIKNLKELKIYGKFKGLID